MLEKQSVMDSCMCVVQHLDENALMGYADTVCATRWRWHVLFYYGNRIGVCNTIEMARKNCVGF